MVGWIVLEFTYIKLNADKKNCTSFFKLNHIRNFHQMMETMGFFY
jgi:hypothetical protein